MSRDYMKSYIDATVEFRNSNQSKESVDKLYALMRELENTSRNPNESLLLSNIYTLLGYHQSAYELFRSIADESSRKDSTKLLVMKNKADAHGDTLGMKEDIQPKVTLATVFEKPKKKAEEEEETEEEAKAKPTRPVASGFRIAKEDEETYTISNRETLIFGKRPKEEKISVNIPADESIEDLLEKIKEHTDWLGSCKSELIDFYNSQVFDDEADDEWYDALDISKVLIITDEKGNVFTSVSCEDSRGEEITLDIEIDNRDIISVNYGK